MVIKERNYHTTPAHQYAPNGHQSNLTAEQWRYVRTDAFKEWFGDWEKDPEEASKFLDENGEPKVFHHATNAVFEDFDERFIGTGNDAGWLGRGFYFYGDVTECSGYGKYEHDVFLNIRNPYIATDEENERLAELNDPKLSREFTERLESNGYDGVYYDGNLRQEAVAFHARQIMDVRCAVSLKPYYNGDITPRPGVVFVFGSNLEGRHGAGAAKVAARLFRAQYGVGEGLTGNAYALPTKDLRVKVNNGYRSISPERITDSIRKLYACARENPDKIFKVAYRNTTKRGLNGYTGYEMMNMFAMAGVAPHNMQFSKEWYDSGSLLAAYLHGRQKTDGRWHGHSHGVSDGQTEYTGAPTPLVEGNKESQKPAESVPFSDQNEVSKKNEQEESQERPRGLHI